MTSTKIQSFQHGPRINRGNCIGYGRKKFIGKDFSIVNESCNFFTVPQIPDDNVGTLYLEKGNQNPPKLTHESIDNLETTPTVSLQRTSFFTTNTKLTNFYC